MGPITLFDKSFLEMLNVDESAIFDALFSANICPIFIAESLADLSKVPPGERSVEKIVSDLARKAPSMHSYPNAEHTSICLGELYGQAVEMRGVPARGGGRVVKRDGKFGLIYDGSEEMDAFNRWQAGRFDELEREVASQWRENLSKADHRELARIVKVILSINERPRNLVEAHRIAAQAIERSDNRFQQLVAAYALLGLPSRAFGEVKRRWVRLGRPSLRDFAPYTAFCLHVEAFFHVCIEKSLISPDRASNRTDIAYLYYLPFCQVFVSQDKLHRSVAPLFLNPSQQFIFGENLKADLRRIDDYYSALPDEQKDEGLFRLAAKPPPVGELLTTEIWKRAGLRTEKQRPTPENSESVEAVLNKVRSLSDGPSTEFGKSGPTNMQDFDHVLIKRQIPRQQGKWNLLPKDFKD